jgi:two-component system OmpR family sensor kinase
MSRKSLLTQITIFFIFLMGVVNTLFYFQYQFQQERQNGSYLKKFHDIRRFLHHSRQERLGFEESKKRLKELLEIEVVEEINTTGLEFVLKHRALRVYREGSVVYLVLNRHRQLILSYKEEKDSVDLVFFILLINGVISIFYIYVMRRLHPLRELKERLIDFANGKVVTMPTTNEEDEIAQLSREFNKSITKIQTLEDSRKLFLRNIMHELNTPIAKGKLITDLMDESKNRDRLQKIFKRFEHLLGEFSKIERVTSNAMSLDKKRYRMVDIVDNALDLLLLEHNDIDIEVFAPLEVEADYELLSIALKNLIDNAIKYGKGKGSITIDRDSLSVNSIGEAIKDLSFETIFNRAFEDSAKGLGLGLYISYNILKKHGFELEYRFSQKVNRFIIKI